MEYCDWKMWLLHCQGKLALMDGMAREAERLQGQLQGEVGSVLHRMKDTRERLSSKLQKNVTEIGQIVQDQHKRVAQHTASLTKERAGDAKLTSSPAAQLKFDGNSRVASGDNVDKENEAPARLLRSMVDGFGAQRARSKKTSASPYWFAKMAG